MKISLGHENEYYIYTYSEYDYLLIRLMFGKVTVKFTRTQAPEVFIFNMDNLDAKDVEKIIKIVELAHCFMRRIYPYFYETEEIKKAWEVLDKWDQWGIDGFTKDN